jgi:SynChlorMet cassette radical SAM/SPASM protein ScmF
VAAAGAPTLQAAADPALEAEVGVERAPYADAAPERAPHADAAPERAPYADAPTPRLARLYFYLTEGCNLACRHCWLAPRYDPDLTSTTCLAPNLFARALDEAVPLGLTDVKLTGGEPLLHPDLPHLLDEIGERDLSVSVETNGTLMTEPIARRLKDLQAHVSVSLDGAEAATHDELRGVPGAFERACNGLTLLAEAGIGPQVIFTVMRRNAAELTSLVRLAEDLGAASVKLNVVQPTARGERLYQSHDGLSVADYLDLAAMVQRELAPACDLTLCFDVPLAFRPLHRLASRGGMGHCAILGVLGVLAGGQYALCGIGEQVPEMVFGAVGGDSLREVWEGHPVLRELREGLPERLGGICGDCVMHAVCLGSCVAQSYYRVHDLFAPFWFCEAALDDGLFPETRRRSCLGGASEAARAGATAAGGGEPLAAAGGAGTPVAGEGRASP